MVYLVKMRTIYDGSQSNSLTRYQKILWECSYGCKNILDFTCCFTMKSLHCHYTNTYLQTVIDRPSWASTLVKNSWDFYRIQVSVSLFMDVPSFFLFESKATLPFWLVPFSTVFCYIKKETFISSFHVLLSHNYMRDTLWKVLWIFVQKIKSKS